MVEAVRRNQPAGLGAGRERGEGSKVIFASLGTVFEWYDFTCTRPAPFFAALFFPRGNETAALLSAFATYAAGFLVRPFGAIVSGASAIVDASTRSWSPSSSWVATSGRPAAHLRDHRMVAPVLLVRCAWLRAWRSAASMARPRTWPSTPHGKRGYDTAWIQTTATLGFFLALAVIGGCRVWMDASVRRLGCACRLGSLVLKVFSVYIRLKLHESPIFQKMKAEGKGSTQLLTDSFLRYPNNKYVLLALLGATAGQAWCGTRAVLRPVLPHHHAQARLPHRVHADRLSLLLGTPFFIFSAGCRTRSVASRSSSPAAPSPRSRTSRCSRRSRTT
jgi:hypothetical protein